MEIWYWIGLRIVSYISAFIGVITACVFIAFFHERIFGIVSSIPLGTALMMAITTGVNVLTASGTAVLLANQVIWPCNIKSLIELFGIIVGAFYGWYF